MAEVYPWSRIATRNCPHCRMHQAQLGVRGTVELDGSDGMVKLLRVGCDYCGYTMLFDLSVMSTNPYRGGEELLPDGVVV